MLALLTVYTMRLSGHKLATAEKIALLLAKRGGRGGSSAASASGGRGVQRYASRRRYFAGLRPGNTSSSVAQPVGWLERTPQLAREVSLRALRRREAALLQRLPATPASAAPASRARCEHLKPCRVAERQVRDKSACLQ